MGLMDKAKQIKQQADNTDVDDKAIAKLKEMRSKHSDEVTDQA